MQINRPLYFTTLNFLTNNLNEINIELIISIIQPRYYARFVQSVYN
jgi:hypothetical protein